MSSRNPHGTKQPWSDVPRTLSFELYQYLTVQRELPGSPEGIFRESCSLQHHSVVAPRDPNTNRRPPD